GRDAPRRHARVSGLRVPHPALSAAPAAGRLPGPRALRLGVQRLRPLHLGADRQPGARRVPDGAAAAPALAPLLERRGERGHDPPARARGVALRALPAVLGRRRRPARRLLLRLRHRVLRVGDAARPRGAAVARRPVTARAGRLRVAAALPALAGIFLFGQATLDRRAWRLDLTPERRYSLSDQATKILDRLPTDVRILAFLRSQDPRNPAIEDLLRRVTGRTARVHVETVDVNRSPALAREYGVDSYGALVVESEGRRRVFSNPREEVLMAALLQVTRQQRKAVGVLVGHGEGDFNDTDRRRGFSTARVFLEQEYYEVRPVSLLSDEVPPEVAVLIVAGPQKDFLPEELAGLDRYLQRPGEALILLHPLPAPEPAPFLRRYDLHLRPDLLLGPRARLYGSPVLTRPESNGRARPPR